MKAITKACDVSMPALTRPRNKKQAYWCTDEIAQSRKICCSAKRTMYRANKSRNTYTSREKTLYREERKKLQLLIRESKRKQWYELSEDVDRVPWCHAYQIIIKRVKGYAAPEPMSLDIVINIGHNLFPLRENVVWKRADNLAVRHFPKEEFSDVEKKIRTKKDPRPDGIPPEVKKILCSDDPGKLRNIYYYNNLLEKGEFADR